ncbi:MAG: hypothetical protein JO246_15475 [Frankiaceae bacterium]|nr:hypothetical protein [Frankiaceae bacterium]MBV9870227.1 hypothetical protein [Frankiaceae bacterium]
MGARIKPDEQFARLLEVHSSVAAGEDAAMGQLANLANALRAVGQSAAMPAPDPAFRAALRQRLVAVATVQASDGTLARSPEARGASAALSWRVQKRIAALASVATLGTSLAGVGVAAAKSLPGDPFYGVKRASEDVQLWVTHGDAAKGRKHLEFARTRLAEAEQLDPKSSHLASTLAAMDAETRAGSAELISAYQSTHSTAPLADLVTFSSQQLTDLNQLADSLPAVAQAREAQSVQVLTGVVKHVHTVAKGVCILCGDGGDNGVPNPAKSPSPNPQRSGNPTRPGGGKPSTRASNHPSSGTPTRPGSGTKSDSPRPTKSSPGTLPISPGPIISSILHPKKTHSPLPVVSSLLGILGGKKKK